MNKKQSVTVAAVVAAAVVVAALFASMYVDLNGKIVSLDSKIQGLQSQIDTLNSGISKAEQPVLVTHLNAYDVDPGYLDGINYIEIEGSVTNVGLTTAFNAGLHVVAKDNASNVLLDMTVPITTGSYGNGANNQGSTTLSTMLSQDTFQVDLQLYHQGIATNISFTPVYTNG